MKNYLVFETDNKNKYIFDNSTGYTIPYSECLIKLVNIDNGKYSIEELLKKMKECTKQNNRKINSVVSEYFELKNQGFFCEYPRDYIKGKEDYYLNLYNSNSSQLLLIVTGKCNLRCKYCVYSDEYIDTITYSDEDMTFDIAKLSINDYMSIYNEKYKRGYNKAPVINFYGGEPLCNFDLIKECVEYSQKEYKTSIDYYITTNGLLLNNEIIEFLIRNNFRVTISLDGDKKNHDRNRITSGGRKTHDEILSNIKLYAKKHQEYENTKSVLSFNCCFDDCTSPNDIINFFENNNIVNAIGKFVFFSQINPYGTTYYEKCEEEYNEGKVNYKPGTWQQEVKSLEEQFISDLKDGKKISEIKKSFFMNYYFYKNRHIGPSGFLYNSCLPGSKIAVNGKGEYFLCERVCEKYSIGNVKSGLDWNRISLLFDKYNHIRQLYCSDCNCSKMCQLCFMHMIEDNSGDVNFNKSYCKNTKEYVPQMLSKLYSILEKNNTAMEGELLYGQDV